MNTNHDHIEELLAGYALGTLGPDDAREADGLLAEHVPDCADCRAMLDDFRTVSGDLALAADAIAPPDLLWPRIKRSMDDKPVHSRRRGALVAVAACAVAIFVLAGWNVILNRQLSVDRSDERQLTSLIKNVMEEDGSQMVSLRNPQAEPTMLAAYLPAQPHTTFLGIGVPLPASGHVYRISALDDGEWTVVADFIPGEGGYVEIDAPMDLSIYEEVVITEEATPFEAGSTVAVAGLAPAGEVRWTAAVDERI